MEKEILEFISNNNITPFENSDIRVSENSVFKTKDAKNMFNRVITRIAEGYSFQSTKAVWKFFPFTEEADVIKKRQKFFSSYEKSDNAFLKQLKKPRPVWKPKYGILVVTEDEKTFLGLQKLNCPVKMINSEYDLAELESYDIVQAVDCESSSRMLENLPQSVFLDSIEEAYLERFFEQLSGWKDNLEILKNNKTNDSIQNIVSELLPLLDIIREEAKEKITRERIELAIEKINDKIEQEMSKLNISGTALMSILNKGRLPEEIAKIRRDAVQEAGIPENLFSEGIPVSINEIEAEKFLRRKDAEEHTSAAEKIKKVADKATKIPEKLKALSNLLVLFDFVSGANKIEGDFPEYSSDFYFENSKNLLLEDSQPISFHLDEKDKCSILTGANSGGKTTLLEHILQLITLFQFGLRVSGKAKIPVFSDVYYFAKNKGASGRGAFENLLSQMDQIETGKKTLILADEIESVTEPGVAGRIISATCEFFIQKGCFMVVATHLGREIQKSIPASSRIDGIEAKGLDEYFELIVDHNPVLGKLASSTPELIIEKLASSKKTDYFKFLNEKVKKKE